MQNSIQRIVTSGASPRQPEEGSAAPIAYLLTFITADFNAENINHKFTRIIMGKMWSSMRRICNDGYEFPSLKNHIGETLTYDGTTLLGADDKALVSILEACLYLTAHPEIPHGDIWLAFGPTKESWERRTLLSNSRCACKICLHFR